MEPNDALHRELQRELQHIRELLETKIGALGDGVYTFRKEILGNGQPGALDRIRAIINEVKTKSDERNSALWKAVDDLRASTATKSDVEDLKKERWKTAGTATAAMAAAAFIGWLLINFKTVFH